MAKVKAQPKAKKTHRYQMTIEFETEHPLKAVNNSLIQFENALPYFAEVTKAKESLNNSFVYGSGKMKIKKLK